MDRFTKLVDVSGSLLLSPTGTSAFHEVAFHVILHFAKLLCMNEGVESGILPDMSSLFVKLGVGEKAFVDGDTGDSEPRKFKKSQKK
ncbi:MAG: hypothetical protein Q8M98_02515 [Candidatus Cloacimonadaceae bacterium]|nr:hypothetical protein [Candidatus Cloacimonadaceae bacterium]